MRGKNIQHNIIELGKDSISLLNNNASIIYDANGYKFFFLPFWFAETDSKEHFEIYHLDNLPDELKRLINQMRGESDEK